MSSALASGTIAAVFDKVLVANRGEIAVRIMRTLREMGIASVAVYSEADRAALHVRIADEAVCVGPAPSAQSYLCIDRVLDACAQTGAQGVHPGYGFLSENAEFAAACQTAGVAFIGPSASAIRSMGSKIEARRLMEQAQIPVVPGIHASSDDALTRAVEQLGLPVLIKASAGGGGKGMRLVERTEQLADSLARARSEATNAFGDDTVYIERALLRPRHVEIQVLGDSHGSIVHLHERDCSIQRRHQKLIEESPSPAVDADLVAKMGQVAVRASQAVNYVSAGTVEFLLAETGEFYFLEMNTRLQVEHPVTELRFGLDLVREQIRIAAGQALGLEQDALSPRGHAIECRVYAEDAESGFLPSPGRIDTLQVPAGPGVRDDSGTYAGATVSPHYDPLVSKLSVWAPDRVQAVRRMRRALNEYVVTGIRTNLAFHQRALRDPDFVSGRYDTGFVEQRSDTLLRPDELRDEPADALAVGAAIALARRHKPRVSSASTASGDGSISAWRKAEGGWR